MFSVEGECLRIEANVYLCCAVLIIRLVIRFFICALQFVLYASLLGNCSFTCQNLKTFSPGRLEFATFEGLYYLCAIICVAIGDSDQAFAIVFLVRHMMSIECYLFNKKVWGGLKSWLAFD